MLRHPHSQGFRAAAEKEIRALSQRNTFKPTTRPSKESGKQILPLMWIFLYKFDQDGYLAKYKARLCIRGDLQKMDAKDTKKKKSAGEQLKAVWPMIWELVRPRRGLLAFSFLLLLIGRVCGLVLPAAPKFLIDDVIGKRRPDLLLLLVAAVAAATLQDSVGQPLGARDTVEENLHWKSKSAVKKSGIKF